MGRFLLLPHGGMSFRALRTLQCLDPVVRQGCLLLLLGRLADLYGRKKVFLAGALWLAAFAIGCAFANGEFWVFSPNAHRVRFSLSVGIKQMRSH